MEKEIIPDMIPNIDTIVTLKPTKEDFHGKRDIPNILKTKREGGLYDTVDSDILAWFGNVKLPKRTESVSGRVHRFNEDTSHGSLIQNKKSFNTYKEYSIRDASELANELILSDAIKEGVKVIIYLSGYKCRLLVWRVDAGTLHVNVFKVLPEYVWKAGHCILF